MKRNLYALILLVALPLTLLAQKSPTYNLLIGTYTTSGKSEGIYVYEFNTLTGDFSYKNKASGVSNPSFLTVSADKRHVYAVNETATGEVSAFDFNPASGTLKLINTVSSGGAHPCYITVDKRNRNVIVGNYSGGTLSVLPILPTGKLGTAVQTIQHSGKGVNKQRQEKAHVHSTVLSPDEKYLLVGDLGLDKVLLYRYNAEAKNKPLSQASSPFAILKAGSGPRHLTFHPNQRFVYVIQELTAQASVFSYQSGKLNPIQSVNLSPEGFTGQVGAADIHVSPDGKFLYASNRGDANEIVIFSIDPKSGKLSFVGRQPTMGKTPRNFAIDPSGNFLLAANQNSDSIIIFKRDKKTGLLKDTGKKIDVGMPVCLVFSSL